MHKRSLTFTLIVLALPALAQAGTNPPPAGIPTLGDFGLVTMGAVLAIGGLLLLTRRRRR
jgi:LPXTG-motif cell wall-anchored protein